MDRPHRRRGIAAALLRSAERRFTALGARRADAMVLDANPEAHLTWQASGYEREEQWRRWVKPLTAPQEPSGR
ncbi:GNAT family N-acetyltransferase [Kitasatospora viridis]|uniref:Acetyltransferase (GNAT) family protein n=1 Tax=Kitasatospora viridis TaxID=281105 RepID=A0A561SFR7_9ACTN|nr:acetyltransferase (GNAT) family protein [Kitasatospora viridis]